MRSASHLSTKGQLHYPTIGAPNFTVKVATKNNDAFVDLKVPVKSLLWARKYEGDNQGAQNIVGGKG